jgi:molybdopterin synthase catalytic subunit
MHSAARVNTSTARSATRRVSAGATGRSAICGGYTEDVTANDRHAISERPLDPVAIAGLVSRSATGGVTTFVGLVRDLNAGKRVLWIDYEAHAALALTVFARIEAESDQRWPDAGLAIHHRIGRVDIGEASVVIAAASPHRADAFAACRFAIERVKQIAPIWKHEHFEDGAVWVEGATADPDDEAALRTAVERACA